MVIYLAFIPRYLNWLKLVSALQTRTMDGWMDWSANHLSVFSPMHISSVAKKSWSWLTSRLSTKYANKKCNARSQAQRTLHRLSRLFYEESSRGKHIFQMMLRSKPLKPNQLVSIRLKNMFSNAISPWASKANYVSMELSHGSFTERPKDQTS